jgi:hypothetical protein
VPSLAEQYPHLRRLIADADAHWVSDQTETAISAVQALVWCQQHADTSWRNEIIRLATQERLSTEPTGLFLAAMLCLAGIIFGPGDGDADDIDLLGRAVPDVHRRLKSAFRNGAPAAAPSYTNAQLARILASALAISS